MLVVGRGVCVWVSVFTITFERNDLRLHLDPTQVTFVCQSHRSEFMAKVKVKVTMHVTNLRSVLVLATSGEWEYTKVVGAAVTDGCHLWWSLKISDGLFVELKIYLDSNFHCLRSWYLGLLSQCRIIAVRQQHLESSAPELELNIADVELTDSDEGLTDVERLEEEK